MKIWEKAEELKKLDEAGITKALRRVSKEEIIEILAFQLGRPQRPRRSFNRGF